MATRTTTQDGPITDAATWGGTLPTSFDDWVIAHALTGAGVTVEYLSLQFTGSGQLTLTGTNELLGPILGVDASWTAGYALVINSGTTTIRGDVTAGSATETGAALISVAGGDLNIDGTVTGGSATNGTNGDGATPGEAGLNGLNAIWVSTANHVTINGHVTGGNSGWGGDGSDAGEGNNGVAGGAGGIAGRVIYLPSGTADIYGTVTEGTAGTAGTAGADFGEWTGGAGGEAGTQTGAIEGGGSYTVHAGPTTTTTAEPTTTTTTAEPTTTTTAEPTTTTSPDPTTTTTTPEPTTTTSSTTTTSTSTTTTAEPTTTTTVEPSNLTWPDENKVLAGTDWTENDGRHVGTLVAEVGRELTGQSGTITLYRGDDLTLETGKTLVFVDDSDALPDLATEGVSVWLTIWEKSSGSVRLVVAGEAIAVGPPQKVAFQIRHADTEALLIGSGKYLANVQVKYAHLDPVQWETVWSGALTVRMAKFPYEATSTTTTAGP